MPTMVKWLFMPESLADRAMRLGGGGVLIAFLVDAILENLTPSLAAKTFVPLGIALALAYTVISSESEGRPLRLPIGALAIGFLWIGILYLLDWTKAVRVPNGYEPVTDCVGTLFFILAWYLFANLSKDGETRNAERLAIVFISTVLVIATSLKLSLTVSPAPIDASSARLLLNMCNGGVLLGMYSQMRRVFPAPDPVSHTMILLYGCAQIAAHGADCLKLQDSTACILPGSAAIVALFIAWVLLLGKISVGLYALYVFSNETSGHEQTE